MIIQSKIQSVTVYKDRALIERIGQVDLQDGEHELIFSGLPEAIDPESLQVNGGKNAVLQNIKLTDVFHEEVPEIEKKQILDRIEEVEGQISELSDRINNTNLEKAFLQNLANVTGESTKKSVIAMFMPEKLQEMLKFYSEKLNTLDNLNRSNNKEINKLNNQLQLLKLQYKQFNQKRLKAEKQVNLKIHLKEVGTINIILSYVVMNASWIPTYDLRLNSEENKLGISYNAIVRQNTGERWDEINLKLSTARPQVSSSTPLLNPWFINIYQHQSPVVTPSAKISEEGDYEKRSLKSEEFAIDDFSEAPMEIAEVKVETGASSVLFAIPGFISISNNNEEHKIGITTLEFATKLEYNSVPKLSPFAYLTSTATNSSDFPLLAGKANVFLDNSFVSSAMLKLIAPNEEFKTSLGVDEGITIEHRLINKFAKDEGIFSKKNKITYEYLVEIKNNKKISILIKVKDQIPVSQNQEIKVELLEPKYKEDSETLKKGIDGTIEWTQNLNTDEKVKLGLKFSIEYPKDLVLEGLE